MDDEKKARRQAMKALRDAQARHMALLSKVEKARAKLERLRHRQQALEAEITDLARRTFEPYTHDSERAMGDGEVRRVRLIFDPAIEGKSDGAKQLREIVKCLRANGLIAEVDLKLSDETLQEMVKEAVEGEEELLIVAGGDEVIEQVASQLVNSQTTLGIIPIGAHHQHAQHLGLPLESGAACALFSTGQVKRIEAGQLVTGAQGSLAVVVAQDDAQPG